MNTSKEYITVAETAKLIRKVLKEKFPTQKFSVRSDSYAGGASIDISWKDGPVSKDVEGVTNIFSGKRFDGMIDMADCISHWLMPDGTIQVAHAPGTEGSRGIYPAIETVQPHPEARLIHFMADYIFCQRAYSQAGLTKVAAEVVAEYSQYTNVQIPVFEVIDGGEYSAHIATRDHRPMFPGSCDSIRDLIMSQASETTL